MTEAHHELAAICEQIGAVTPLWTQGAGSNVSVKTNRAATPSLLIKASGWRLDAVRADLGQAVLPLGPLQTAMQQLPPGAAAAEAAYAAALGRLADRRWQRPSMETGFHALLHGRVVLHFHSVVAQLLAHCHATAPARLEAVWPGGSDGAWICLPPLSPGLQLMRALRPHAHVPIVVLANHGVILQGEAAAPLLARWRRLERALCRACGWELLEAALQEPAQARRWSRALLAQGLAARPLFFDSAVFWERLQALAAAPGGRWRLPPQAPAADHDALEMLQATAVLAHLCPTLDALPQRIVSAVVDLPTERWRQRQGAPSPNETATDRR